MTGFPTTSSPLLQSPFHGVWMVRAEQVVPSIPSGFRHGFKRRSPG
jgi:hypothetical protein